MGTDKKQRRYNRKEKKAPGKNGRTKIRREAEISN